MYYDIETLYYKGNLSIQPEVVIVGHLLLYPVRLKTVNKKSPGKRKNEKQKKSPGKRQNAKQKKKKSPGKKMLYFQSTRNNPL